MTVRRRRVTIRRRAGLRSLPATSWSLAPVADSCALDEETQGPRNTTQQVFGGGGAQPRVSTGRCYAGGGNVAARFPPGRPRPAGKEET